ncbi:type VI secretion system baseplate subunit TssE [Trabulsiella odontotermitis]|uniref:Type VI secretion protein n=1 Tax=Trabulsiella odontotermitis TaxID=379893 RepID=A0A0L0GQU9_9ENTR|nr:type VI secretion system baseplate subunit TssE [Trabulsiella odontotermitis]KNC91337.1 type VI secretion protein [Trabulsiella odontotermitis]KNC92498.1 type VI secretion protein [Trabulsiella odontotermitis]
MTERGFGGSLFERIGDAATLSPRRKPKMVLLHSILHNLQNILNTRSGSCYGSPELGISDLNDEALISRDFRSEIGHGLHDCILQYEPRIDSAVVTAATADGYSPLELRFHIMAQVGFDEAVDVLEFDILLDSHQHFQVE